MGGGDIVHLLKGVRLHGTNMGGQLHAAKEPPARQVPHPMVMHVIRQVDKLITTPDAGPGGQGGVPSMQGTEDHDPGTSSRRAWIEDVPDVDDPTSTEAGVEAVMQGSQEMATKDAG